ncbi:nucleoid-associated protein [Clostridium sediminicola]|uniref:nucleoid-associated protein n=1 Tax=Clostridium sediminicola TaxID=3114879 RepID=UPI0031F1FAC1
MEYITDLTINEAVVHILDNNSDEPVLNEYKIELNEELYNYLDKHIKKCFKDEELRYAVFKEDRNIIKDLSQEYLNGVNNIMEVSKEVARQLFVIMRSKGNIPSCDLMVVSISTEYGPMLCILKMDYIKNYMHSIDFVEDKIGINIVTQYTGLPSSGQRLQKCAFIKLLKPENNFDLMVIDKVNKKDKDDYGSNYFISNFLGCNIVDNERDITKTFINAAEKWTRTSLKEKADVQEQVRSELKKHIKKADNIDINQISQEILKEDKEAQESFVNFVKEQGVSDNIQLDKQWIDKKLKRVRLKIDKDIDIYINEEAYDDNSRFEIIRNGDGTINMIIKHVSHYLEK